MHKLLLLCFFILLPALCQAKILTVDDDGPADFNNVQAAIDFSQDGDIIIVQPGYFEGEERYLHKVMFKIIDFKGKNITLTSTNPSNFDTVSSTVLNTTVMFRGTEDSNCTLSGFKIINDWACGGIVGKDLWDGPESPLRTKATITNCIIQKITISCWGIYCCDGLIKNCLISDNLNQGGIVLLPAISNCHGKIIGCTIASNWGDFAIDVGPDSGHLTIENCIVYGNFVWGSLLNQICVPEGCSASISYCNIENGIEGIDGTGNVSWGPGNIDVDPYFVREGFWDDNEGDYHLKSEAGRWDPNIQSWVIDDVTSLCIDAGNPGCPLRFEPKDVNNIRINMGAFGCTPLASKTPANWALLADLTNDGIVDFYDFSYQVSDWQKTGECQPGDLNRDSIIDLIDIELFINDWLKQTIFY